MTEKEVLEIIEEAAGDGRTKLDLSGKGIVERYRIKLSRGVVTRSVGGAGEAKKLI
jgi:hypothetical protein